jgi:hypothetical protein
MHELTSGTAVATLRWYIAFLVWYVAFLVSYASAMNPILFLALPCIPVIMLYNDEDGTRQDC